MILSHDLAGENTPEDIKRWFTSGPNERYAGIVFVAGVRDSRESAAGWLEQSRNCRDWNALFALRYREHGGERWLIVGRKRAQVQSLEESA